MTAKILKQLKSNLQQIQNHEEYVLVRKSEKEQRIKQKREKLAQIGTKKIYYEIWRQILKNIKKDYFLILIDVKFEEGSHFVSKIKVNNKIKKITRTPINIHYLNQLLSDDNIYIPSSVEAYKPSKEKFIFNLTITRNKLNQIMQKTEEKNMTQKKLSMN